MCQHAGHYAILVGFYTSFQQRDTTDKSPLVTLSVTQDFHVVEEMIALNIIDIYGSAPCRGAQVLLHITEKACIPVILPYVGVPAAKQYVLPSHLQGTFGMWPMRALRLHWVSLKVSMKWNES